MIRGIKFASIPVVDQDRALAFYTERLGFHVVTDSPFSDEQRWIELGIANSDAKVVLWKGEQSPELASVSFWSSNVAKTVDELKAKGVEVVRGPEDADWGTYAIFKDSEGNQFVLSSK